MTAALHILCVGRGARDPAAALAERYLKRLPVAARITEVSVRGGGSGAERRRREAMKLRSRIPDGALVVALDGRGESFSSPAFAAALARWQESGRPLTFLIGGADGLDPMIVREADVRLSLSAMTWPHMLARAMLAEQLYRAFAILKGHPYHR